MQTLQPQHPDAYRALPPPNQMYAPPYPHPQMGYPPPQPAPRQRTAIACRYCRRRKVRTFDAMNAPHTDRLFRSAAQASIKLRMAAAPTVCVSRKNASSHPSPLRPRPLCQRTLFGGVTTHLRTLNSTVLMVSRCLKVAAIRTHRPSSRASTRRLRRAISSQECISSRRHLSKWARRKVLAKSAPTTGHTPRLYLPQTRLRKRRWVVMGSTPTQILLDLLILVRRLLSLLAHFTSNKHLFLLITTSLRCKVLRRAPQHRRGRSLRRGTVLRSESWSLSMAPRKTRKRRTCKPQRGRRQVVVSGERSAPRLTAPWSNHSTVGHCNIWTMADSFQQSKVRPTEQLLPSR